MQDTRRDTYIYMRLYTLAHMRLLVDTGVHRLAHAHICDYKRERARVHARTHMRTHAELNRVFFRDFA